MTNEEEKQKIRPIYRELQGYLQSVPNSDSSVFYDSDPEWKQLNNTIDLLNTISGKDYNRFKVELIRGGGGHQFVRMTSYKQKLSGLIGNLQAEYFNDEQEATGNPSVIVNQSQQQTQTVLLVLELQGLIDKQLYEGKLDEKEKSFLEKVRSSIPAVKSATEYLALVLSIAKDFGFSAERISKIFGF